MMEVLSALSTLQWSVRPRRLQAVYRIVTVRPHTRSQFSWCRTVVDQCQEEVAAQRKQQSRHQLLIITPKKQVISQIMYLEKLLNWRSIFVYYAVKSSGDVWAPERPFGSFVRLWADSSLAGEVSLLRTSLLCIIGISREEYTR